MKKIALTFILCSILTCSAFSCGDSSAEKDGAESKPSESSTTTAGDENTSETTKSTISIKDSEGYKNFRANLQKKTEEINEKHRKEMHNTDEMDKEAKKVVNVFVQAVCDDDAEAMAKAMYPEKMLEGMKACGEYDEFAQSVTDGETDKLDRVDVMFCVKMKENENALAESYMNYYAKEYGLSDTEYKVSEGYSFTASMHTTHNDGTKALGGEALLIVNIEGEGWKILPMSLKDLTE
ncbi:MAG: hypothetical protein IJJ81_01000 [Ruminococcus sp.]|nr:hypothetical protein [Ruminococcus sp.]